MVSVQEHSECYDFDTQNVNKKRTANQLSL